MPGLPEGHRCRSGDREQFVTGLGSGSEPNPKGRARCLRRVSQPFCGTLPRWKSGGSIYDPWRKVPALLPDHRAADWCSSVYDADMPQKEKQLRQSISLPSKTARRVRSLAKACRKSASRVLVDLVEAGLEAREAERMRFFELADRLARSEDSEEQARIKAELARLTFGD